MKICHVCKAECEDNSELCPVCGADLSSNNDGENQQIEANVLNNPVLLATVDDVVSAEIFKDLLRENGIPFTGDEPNAGTLKVTFGGAFVADDIYVDDADFEKANQLYEEFLNSEPEFDETFFDEDDNGEYAESEENEE